MGCSSVWQDTQLLSSNVYSALYLSLCSLYLSLCSSVWQDTLLLSSNVYSALYLSLCSLYLSLCSFYLSFCSSVWQDTQLLPPDFYSAPPSSRIILFCHNSAKKWYVYHLVLLA